MLSSKKETASFLKEQMFLIIRLTKHQVFYIGVKKMLERRKNHIELNRAVFPMIVLLGESCLWQRIFIELKGGFK